MVLGTPCVLTSSPDRGASATPQLRPSSTAAVRINASSLSGFSVFCRMSVSKQPVQAALFNSLLLVTYQYYSNILSGICQDRWNRRVTIDTECSCTSLFSPHPEIDSTLEEGVYSLWYSVGYALPIVSASTMGKPKAALVGKALIPFPPPLRRSVNDVNLLRRLEITHISPGMTASNLSLPRTLRIDSTASGSSPPPAIRSLMTLGLP